MLLPLLCFVFCLLSICSRAEYIQPQSEKFWILFSRCLNCLLPWSLGENIESAFSNTPLSLSALISFPPQIWRKTIEVYYWLLLLRHGKLLFCKRIQAVKWFIPCLSLSHLIEHAVKLCRWARRWNPALICCRGGRCFIPLVRSLAFLSVMKQEQKKLNCRVLSLLFSKVVLQLIPPVTSAECEKRYAPPDFSYKVQSCALYFHR